MSETRIAHILLHCVMPHILVLTLSSRSL